jgi:hypothetical protein
MITIAMIVCNALGTCQNVTLPIDQQLANLPFACIKFGQEAGAKWLDEHPGWKIARIDCKREHEHVDL